MQTHSRISRTSISLAATLALACGAMLIALYNMETAENELLAAEEARHKSYLLADELRQSSDDLTRFARSYVTTGDAKFKDLYARVLDIRNGEAPRPQDYHRIYWDLVIPNGQEPRPTGETRALQARMKEAGFTDAEFDLLKKAQANSDGLVKLEEKAMGAVTTLNETGAEETENGITRMDAIQMLFSADYHKHKADIMRPIDKFFASVEARTQGRIDAAHSATERAALMGWIAAGVLVILVAAQLMLLRWRLIAPLASLRDAMQALASDTGEAEVPGTDKADEIGDMARATDIFKTNKAEAERLRAEQDEMSARATADRRRTREHLADQLNKSIGDVVEDLTGSGDHMEKLAETLKKTASQAEMDAGSVSAAADQASNHVRTVASATEEMTASVREIAGQAQDSTRIAAEAAAQSNETREQVEGLAKAAERIGEVVTLINDIAEQTNLLALNATIEAARAGEAGKGFAVVANEVKSLAQQTGNATQEIQTQVSAIQGETQTAVSAIGRITETVNRINESIAGIASGVEQQENTTGEIARSIEEVSDASSTVAERVRGLREVAENTGSAAEDVRSQASTFGKHAQTLRKEVDGFVAGMRDGGQNER